MWGKVYNKNEKNEIKIAFVRTVDGKTLSNQIIHTFSTKSGQKSKKRGTCTSYPLNQHLGVDKYKTHQM